MKLKAENYIILGLSVLCLYAFFQIYQYQTREHDYNNMSKILEQKSSQMTKILYDEVRILCCLVTYPDNHKTKAIHAMRTWGKRCNKLVVFSTADDVELHPVILEVGEGKKYLWAKTKELFKQVYDLYLDDADWVLKVDDDSYVVMENLRYMLYPYSSNQSIYFGLKLKNGFSKGYMQGGAYVISKEAVIQLVEKGIPNKNICFNGTWYSEDIEMAKCLDKLNVTRGDSRDIKGQSRFLYNPPHHHIAHLKKDERFWKYLYYKSEKRSGMNCCSDEAISFHHVPSHEFYTYEYLIYKLKHYGSISNLEQLPPKLSSENYENETSTDQI